MGKRQREWARKVRDSIFDQLGRKCVKCGATEKLEFDVIHPVGNDDHHRKMEWSWRMTFYKRQLEAANLQILCEPCNKHKYNQLELTNYQQVENPF